MYIYTGSDPGILSVLTYLADFDDLEARVGRAIREAMDSVLAGRYTGRYSIEQLDKVEKTYIGTKVEHFLLDTLKLPKHQKIDTRVSGVKADVKFTIRNNWTIPSEAMDEICILVTASEKANRFRMGLLRITPERLNAGRNKDGKGTLNATGRKAIYWVIENGRLPRNVLLEMNPLDREAVLFGTGGTARMTELFRRNIGKVIDGVTVETVGQQRDSSKRVRKDGGARDVLIKEGIDIFSNMHNPILGTAGISPLKRGEFMALPVDEQGRPFIFASSLDSAVTPTVQSGVGWGTAADAQVGWPGEGTLRRKRRSNRVDGA